MARGGCPCFLTRWRRRTLDEPWEVVVVLDGDVDGSRALLESYADRVPMRIVERAGGDGVAAALAAGYEEARGEIVLRCDDDLTPPPGSSPHTWPATAHVPPGPRRSA